MTRLVMTLISEALRRLFADRAPRRLMRKLVMTRLVMTLISEALRRLFADLRTQATNEIL